MGGGAWLPRMRGACARRLCYRFAFAMSATTRTGPILDRIVEARRIAIEKGKRRFPLAALHMAVKKAEPVRDYAGALSRDSVNVIAELKNASP